jgi:carbon-monoxide dehydrogenase medium subunit
VLTLLAEHGDSAKLLAGGQSLLMLMRHRLVNPAALVSLARVEGLRGLEIGEQGLTLGPMVTERTIERHAEIRRRYPAIAQAAAQVGSVPIRNLGTIGGNLCHAEPGADPPAAMIACGAVAHLTSQTGARDVPLEDFFVDYLETVVRSDEMLAAIRVPPPAPRSAGAYLKFTRRAVDLAIVGIAVVIGLAEADGVCASARIGINGGALTPLRARQAEQVLAVQALTDESIAAAADAAAAECDPLSDIHASAEYKRKIVRVYTARALRAAAREAGVALD